MANKARESTSGSSEPNDRDDFLKVFRDVAARRGLAIVRWTDDGVECRDPSGETVTLSLHNLFRSCCRHERTNWPDIIDHFLGNVGSIGEVALPEDLNAVADQVLPRLGPPISRQGVEGFWWKQLVPERIWVNLVIDYPTRMAYVSKELIDRSGQSGEYWLTRALDNLRARSSPDMVPVVNEEIGLRLIGTEDSYDAARALILDPLLPETEPFGCFVAPIGRDQVLLLPVAVQALAHVHILKLLARDNYPKVPYAISDSVFWVWRGQWRLFPIEIKDKSITVQPPEEFIEVLNLLSSAKEDGPEQAGEAEGEG
jgi:hypothetical protein